MNPDLSKEVFAMVSEFTGVRPQELTPETTLFHDLGIDGLDADAFFEEFEKTFNVDLTNFKIGKYFGSEGSEPISSIVIWIQGWWTGDHHSAAGVVPITLGDLTEAARVGRWIKN